MLHHDRKAIAEAFERQLAHGRYESDFVYGDGMAGPRIADLLAVEELTTEKKLAY